MWRTYVALFVIAAILLGGILMLNYTDSICDKIEHYLTQTLFNVESKEADDLDAILKAHQIWEKNADLLCMLISHNRIEEISVSFQRAFAFYEMEELAEYNAQIREILTCLQYVRLYDMPTLANIF